MTLILSGTDGLSDVDGSAATPAIRGTDANTGIFFPAADTIGFAEGGAEVMRITSAGYTQFGADGTTSTLSITPTVTSRPSTSAPMIQTTGGGGSGVYANAGQLIISGRPTDTSTFGNIYIQTGATQQNQWVFNNGAAFVLPGGTATTTGTGITFPATQSASSDANTLDDYEEGTFTPSLFAGGANMVSSYNDQRYGVYRKIGSTVFWSARIADITKNAQSGDVTIQGLPFTTSSANIISAYVWAYSGITTTGTLIIRSNTGATSFILQSTTTAGSGSQIQASNINGGNLNFCANGFYIVD